MTIDLPDYQEQRWDIPLNKVLGQLGSGWLPDDYNYAAWTYDPAQCSAGALLANGFLYLNAIKIRNSDTVSAIAWTITTAGVTPTAGQNFIGLYNPSGTLVASTNIDADITVVSAKETAITAQGLIPGTYRVGIVVNAVTPPTLLSGVDSIVRPNQLLSVENLRSARQGAALTALPGTALPSNNSATGSKSIFAGLRR